MMRLTHWVVLIAVLTISPGRSGAADPPPAAAAPLKITCVEYHWKRGEPPVRMIRKDEGVCYLSQVQGHFAGAGESVGVYLDADGYWYLGGTSDQDGMGASAIAVRYPAKVELTMMRAPSARMLADLAALEKSESKAVREAAADELKEPPPDPQAEFAKAQAWLTLAEKDASRLRGVMEAHAIDLLRSAANAAAGAGVADDTLATKANALADERAVAFAGRYLNDLSQWAVLRGKWEAGPDGKIVGRGNSSMRFRAALPADGEISFHLNVLEGMRPRIYFEGTDLYVGNEGYDRVLEMHGAQAQRGVKFPYQNGQDIAITVKLSEPNFELWVDRQLMSKGSQKKVPATMTLRIMGGDDWSPGACQYWGFEFKSAKAAAAPAEKKR